MQFNNGSRKVSGGVGVSLVSLWLLCRVVFNTYDDWKKQHGNVEKMRPSQLELNPSRFPLGRLHRPDHAQSETNTADAYYAWVNKWFNPPKPWKDPRGKTRPGFKGEPGQVQEMLRDLEVIIEGWPGTPSAELASRAKARIRDIVASGATGDTLKEKMDKVVH